MAELVPEEPLSFPRREPERPEIPGYEIEGVIGRGATGVVYRARQEAVDRHVALKVLHSELASKPRIVQRLQREARTTARLAHPHVVSCIDMGETASGQWWYAMELVDGPSLALRLRQEGRLKEREALRLVIPLVEALEHLLEHGVVHRDIKPSNILIDRVGGARIADLGLAFADDDPALTKQGGTLGTPHYISPEQAVDPSSADVRSDLWSLGATLFHAVCGRPPFLGDSTAEVLSAVLHARVPDPFELEPELSKGLGLVLRKCLVRDPARRYQTPRELLLDLERVRERRAPKVVRSTLDPVEGQVDVRRMLVVAGGVGVALALVVAGFFVFAKEGGAEDDGGATVIAPEPFAPLEEVARRVGDARANLALLAGELDELVVPPEHTARRAEVERALRAEARRRLDRLAREVDARVDLAVARGDFVAAAAGLAGELEAAVFDATGHRLADVGGSLDAPRFASWLAGRRAALELKRDNALGQLAGAVRQAGLRILADVEGPTNDYRRTLARLDVGEAELLAEAGYAGWRFPAELLPEELYATRVSLDARRREIERNWAMLDGSLATKVRDQARSIEERLLSRELRTGAAAQLRAVFERDLRAAGVARERMPDGLSRRGLDELEHRADLLDELEDQLLGDDLRAVFAQNERECGPNWTRRNYGDIRKLWSEFAAGIGPSPEGRAGGWREELAREARHRSEDARLLEGLLARAAETVRALDGTERELAKGAIRVVGRIEAGTDPLGQGFRLVDARGNAFALDLRTMPSAEVESLAELGADDATLAPSERLLRMLFRFREGDLTRALQASVSGELPRDAADDDYVLELQLRLGDALEASRTDLAAREAAAAEMFARVTPDRIASAPRLVEVTIDDLLEDYGDTPFVRTRRAELLRWKAKLAADRGRVTEADFERAFGADSIELRVDRARMTFAFEHGEVGAWERGAHWSWAGDAWSPTREVASLDELLARPGPRLVLGAPAALERGPFSIELTVEEPATEPPKLLVVSAGDFHVALAGAKLPGGGGVAVWLAGTGELSELFRRLAAGEGMPVEAELERGGTHVVEIAGNQSRGTVSLSVDGEVVGRATLAPADESERAVFVRAWERVRLTKIVVDVAR